jgi:hypothetical protein
MKQLIRKILRTFARRDETPYPSLSAETPYPSLSAAEILNRNRDFNARRKFKQDAYADLLSPYIGNFENLTLIEYVRETEIGDRKILLIRHDIDHDYQTALKIAQWEYQHGLKTTYCVLHTAWYYGYFEKGRILHTQNLVDLCKRLVDLGHEVNLHNNLVVTALTEDVSPADLLSQELDFFNSIGIRITGTASHGDKLCHQLNFRNWELFKECTDNRFGGPRVISFKHKRKIREVMLSEMSMFDFGLEYEGYDILRDVYHTESRGRLRTHHNARGRRPFGRKDPTKGSVIGVLTHPEWWEFR